MSSASLQLRYHRIVDSSRHWFDSPQRASTLALLRAPASRSARTHAAEITRLAEAWQSSGQGRRIEVMSLALAAVLFQATLALLAPGQVRFDLDAIPAVARDTAAPAARSVSDRPIRLAAVVLSEGDALATQTCPPPRPASSCDGTWAMVQLGMPAGGPACSIGWQCLSASPGRPSPSGGRSGTAQSSSQSIAAPSTR